jgi:Matrixin
MATKTSVMLAALASALVAQLAVVKSAAAFCRTTTVRSGDGDCVKTGLPLFWRGACLGYRTSTAEVPSFGIAAATDLLAASYADWSSGGCKASIQAVSLGTSSNTNAGYIENASNENLIVFRKVWPYPDRNQVALTTLTFRTDTGEIVDADIEVNASLDLRIQAAPLPARGYDLRTVFAHEGGHVLGLAHSDVANATMFAKYAPGSVDQGTQEPDDYAGLCAAYPANNTRVTSKGEEPAGACKPDEPVSLAVDQAEQPGCKCNATATRPTGATLLTAVLCAAWLGAKRRRASR